MSIEKKDEDALREFLADIECLDALSPWTERFKWLPKVSLPKLLSSICTRTAEVGGGKLSAETSALPRAWKGFLCASRL